MGINARDRDLFDQTGIYPTQDGGVIVLMGGVAEVLTTAEAISRLSYVEARGERIRREISQGGSDNAEQSLAISVMDQRIMAYQAAIYHGAKK